MLHSILFIVGLTFYPNADFSPSLAGFHLGKVPPKASLKGASVWDTCDHSCPNHRALQFPSGVKLKLYRGRVMDVRKSFHLSKRMTKRQFISKVHAFRDNFKKFRKQNRLSNQSKDSFLCFPERSFCSLSFLVFGKKNGPKNRDYTVLIRYNGNASTGYHIESTAKQMLTLVGEKDGDACLKTLLQKEKEGRDCRD